MARAAYQLGSQPLTLEVLSEVALEGRPVTLGAAARERLRAARQTVELIQRGGNQAPAVYGVNTGFGFLADVRISERDVRQLQKNLIRSHAAGIGPRRWCAPCCCCARRCCSLAIPVCASRSAISCSACSMAACCR